MRPNEITEVLNRPISQELLARDVTRLAYVAKDGTPRNVPIIFTWNGSHFVAPNETLYSAPWTSRKTLSRSRLSSGVPQS